jgi:hypothetical protein
MKGFLNQRLPSFPFHFGPSKQPRLHDRAPSLVTEWDSVNTEISNFVNSQSGRRRLFRDPIIC